MPIVSAGFEIDDASEVAGVCESFGFGCCRISCARVVGGSHAFALF